MGVQLSIVLLPVIFGGAYAAHLQGQDAAALGLCVSAVLLLGANIGRKKILNGVDSASSDKQQVASEPEKELASIKSEEQLRNLLDSYQVDTSCLLGCSLVFFPCGNGVLAP